MSGALLGPVHVTGCSSGMGRAAATRLRTAAATADASARRPDSVADLAV